MSKSISQKSLGETLLKATRLSVKSPLRKFSRNFSHALTSIGYAPNNAAKTLKAARALKAGTPAVQSPLSGKPGANQPLRSGAGAGAADAALPDAALQSASQRALRLEKDKAKGVAARPHWTDPLVDAFTSPALGLAQPSPDAPPARGTAIAAKTASAATARPAEAAAASVPGQADEKPPVELATIRPVEKGAAMKGKTLEPFEAGEAVEALDVTEPAPAGGAVKARRGVFSEGVFDFDGQSYPFRLYVPEILASKARAAPKPSRTTNEPGSPWSATTLVTAASVKAAPPAAAALPLIVLLHGCKQNALDFAQGTAMNELADANQCMVLYPEQLPRANSGRCWNWFEPAHQQRDTGEPGMIAALTRQVLDAEHKGRRADPQRAYIAGLSAGGAMAAVVADLYPDIFAAVGVHSGLPAGAANGMVAAFGAMSRGAKGQAATPLPTIIFHGTADRTVHPDNGNNVSDAALVALRASGLALVKSSSKPSRSRADPLSTSTAKTIYRAANGPSYIEHWKVEEGPHAWSGGSAEGSFTDPDGPSASAAMMAFFLQHSKSAGDVAGG